MTDQISLNRLMQLHPSIRDEAIEIIESVGKDKFGNILSLCKCYCGTFFITRYNAVKTGHTKSCGCLNKKVVSEITIVRNTTHGKRHTVEYNSWRAMKERCTNPNHHKYQDYAERGIKVCDRWLKSFENFFNDMGLKPTLAHSIDRIDNNGDYTPKNCKWSTPKEQANNTRRNKKKC